MQLYENTAVTLRACAGRFVRAGPGAGAPAGTEPQRGRLSETRAPEQGRAFRVPGPLPVAMGVLPCSRWTLGGRLDQAGVGRQTQSLLLWAQPKIQGESNPDVLAPSPA